MWVRVVVNIVNGVYVWADAGEVMKKNRRAIINSTDLGWEEAVPLVSRFDGGDKIDVADICVYEERRLLKLPNRRRIDVLLENQPFEMLSKTSGRCTLKRITFRKFSLWRIRWVSTYCEYEWFAVWAIVIEENANRSNVVSGAHYRLNGVIDIKISTVQLNDSQTKTRQRRFAHKFYIFCSGNMMEITIATRNERYRAKDRNAYLTGSCSRRQKRLTIDFLSQNKWPTNSISLANAFWAEFCRQQDSLNRKLLPILL